jgi:hypothetical protein
MSFGKQYHSPTLSLPACSVAFRRAGTASDLSAISMPIDLDRSNRMIVKRITKKGGLDENKRK